jgi:hypothetical protein
VDCSEHPGRAATTPCVRCGGFICDWCVKLAPSWGAGLCLTCQKRAPNSAVAVPKTRMFIVAGSALLIGPFLSLMDLNDLLKMGRAAADTADKHAAAIATIGIVLVLAMMAANVVGAALFFMRRHAARGVLIALFAVKLVMNLLGAAAQPGVASIVAVTWSAALLAYFALGDAFSTR